MIIIYVSYLSTCSVEVENSKIMPSPLLAYQEISLVQFIIYNNTQYASCQRMSFSVHNIKITLVKGKQLKNHTCKGKQLVGVAGLYQNWSQNVRFFFCFNTQASSEKFGYHFPFGSKKLFGTSQQQMLKS